MTVLRIAAFVAARNEAGILRRSLGHLIDNGIEVTLIDNASSDGVSRLVEQYRASGAKIDYEYLPYHGCFDLKQQLQAKADLIATSRADWVLHLDADEMPHSRRDGESLSETIARVDRAGYNVLNFDEFVFLPIDPTPREIAGWCFPFPHYYFFQPKEKRLMRAWRRDQGFTNVLSGGHRLAGDRIKVYPESAVLRHYPFLSQEHALQKYIGRSYAEGDLVSGWHLNRIGVPPECFAFPSLDELQTLGDIGSHRLDYSRPRLSHYWEWTRQS